MDIKAIQELSKVISTCANLYLKASLATPNTLTGWSLDERDPRVIAELLRLYGWFYRYYFRVKTDGWENIPKDQQVLLIGSHNGGLAAPDMSMMIYDWFRRFGTEKLTYGLMDARVWKFLPGSARLATQVGAIQAHPRMAIAALNRGASLLIYPGGIRDVFRPYALRNSIYFAGNRAFIKLALRYELPIIPFICYGAHATLLVLGDIYPQLQQLEQWGLLNLTNLDLEVFPIYLGLPWGIGIGPLPNIPLPIQLHTRVCPPIVFAKYGEQAARDQQYVNQCYDLVCQLMQQQLDQLVREEKTKREY
ncbi:MAG: acyltransferase family protein [Gloeocapsa sp. DLM2.Bin57]|nr:MAG: acyltransferase family protein [Gloeocapsa sp. DLM2.Bin57]